ncbi:hypothetical protein NDU88_001793 [Pleurodeles waltl]|uniref:Uncharacterized protein n=1 Tax=Pleurodeles waltl TaxID=8319 RepID=A0AAV7UBE3_PLEWA|nr:hypothetical protein NDU88_001793 [Pleurodeles waltl]
MSDMRRSTVSSRSACLPSLLVILSILQRGSAKSAPQAPGPLLPMPAGRRAQPWISAACCLSPSPAMSVHLLGRIQPQPGHSTPRVARGSGSSQVKGLAAAQTPVPPAQAALRTSAQLWRLLTSLESTDVRPLVF